MFTSLIKQPVAVTDIDDDEFFDAPDHFSDDEFDDDDDEQAPDDDISEMVIKFHQLAVWNNSEDNIVEYVLPPNFGKLLCTIENVHVFHASNMLFLIVDGGSDWIGVYRENYTGFDEYIGYEYTETHGEKSHTSPRTVTITFSASIDLPLDGNFVMLYFQSTGIRGYSSMLGVSDPFPVIKRCPSPRPDTID